VTALSQGPELTLTIGALFSTSLDALALSIQSVTIGSEHFSTLPTERPTWLTRLLQELGTRFRRHQPDPDLAAVVLAAATSRDRFKDYQSWQAALAEPLGPARVARGAGGAPVLLIEDRPIRRWGARGLQLASLAASVHLYGADVLWVESAEPLLVPWSDALEQLWQLSPAGNLAVVPDPPRMRRASHLRARP